MALDLAYMLIRMLSELLLLQPLLRFFLVRVLLVGFNIDLALGLDMNLEL